MIVELALELEIMKGKKRAVTSCLLLQAGKFATIDLSLGYIHNGNLYLAQHITSLNVKSNGLANLVVL